MRILILGAGGQLGNELGQTLINLGEVKALDRDKLDLTNFPAIRSIITSYQPDWIINAAAYTAVDKAESEPGLAFKINAEAAAVIAEEAKKNNAWLIHYSTDYVFDGEKATAYGEQDQTNPINIYGKSKLAGEEAVQKSGCNYIIFRTTWIMGSYGNNFAKIILRLAKEKGSLNIINDQYGVPTTTDLIAKVTQSAIEMTTKNSLKAGIYHLVPYGQTTWYGIADKLIEMVKQKRPDLISADLILNPINTSEYPTPAKRPKNSMLNNRKLQQLLDFELPNWEVAFITVANKIIKEL